MNPEELRAALAELKARPEPEPPWGLGWLDRLTEPASPWTARLLLVTTLCLWVWSLFNIAMLALAAGGWLAWTNASETLQKERSKARIRAFRAEMAAIEHELDVRWRWQRFERMLVPDWML